MKDEVNSQESRMPASQVPATAGDKCRPAGPPPHPGIHSIKFTGFKSTKYLIYPLGGMMRLIMCLVSSCHDLAI